MADVDVPNEDDNNDALRRHHQRGGMEEANNGADGEEGGGGVREQQQQGPRDDNNNEEQAPPPQQGDAAAADAGVNNANNDNDDEANLLNERIARLEQRRRNFLLHNQTTQKSRFQYYTLLSLTSATGLVYWTFYTRQQFYPAVVYLTSSKFAYVTLGNAWVCLTVLLFRVITYTFLNGGLRDVEREAIGDGLRWGLMETCLALTIFREEVTVSMASMFLLLALSKCLHWSVELRGGHLQQTDMADHVAEINAAVAGGERNNQANANKKSQHFGFFLLTLLLLLSDVYAVIYCSVTCAKRGPSVHILFGFEAAILGISSLSTLCTYTLHVIDTVLYASRNKTFHNRGYVAFLLEVATESCKFLFYLIFFTIVFTYYGMPINIFRDLWMSYTQLKKKLSSFAKYRRLTSNMNERFASATPSELEECGSICIICRDVMESGKKLPCGHVFHFYCLREWLQQQQSCPTCRADITATEKKLEMEKRRREAAEGRAANNTENGGAGAGAGTTTTSTTTGGTTVTGGGKESERVRTSWSKSGSAAVALNGNGAMGGDRDDMGSPFPCLYRVTSPHGVRVYELTSGENPYSSITWWYCRRIRRTVPACKLILVTDMQWVRCPLKRDYGEKPLPGSRMMIRMPDGWIIESEVERIPIPLSGWIQPQTDAI